MQVLMKAQDFQSLLVLAKPISKIQMILPCQDLTACLETIQNLTISNLERIFNCCTPSSTQFSSVFCWRYDWLAGGMENWCLPGICTCEWHLWRLWTIGLGHPSAVWWIRNPLRTSWGWVHLSFDVQVSCWEYYCLVEQDWSATNRMQNAAGFMLDIVI